MNGYPDKYIFFFHFRFGCKACLSSRDKSKTNYLPPHVNGIGKDNRKTSKKSQVPNPTVIHLFDSFSSRVLIKK